jgi:hypothetical protein
MKKTVIIKLEFDTIEPTKQMVIEYLAELIEQENLSFEVIEPLKD